MKSNFGRIVCFCAIALLLIAAVPISMAANPMYTVHHDLSGKWKMVGNVAYEFDLDIQQSGDQITGTMTRTNGNEPTDSISGTIPSDGKIEFTRVRQGDFTQVYTGQVLASGASLKIEGSYNHNNAGQYPWRATKSTETVASTTSLEVDGSAWQAEAAPDNSKEASMLVNVSKSSVSPGPLAVGSVAIVTGLQDSSFSVETMQVPAFGANVKMVEVSEQRPGRYTLAIVPESYKGTQYKWLEGTYQLKVTVTNEGLSGQVDIPLTIAASASQLASAYDLSGKWKMVGNSIYNFDLDIQQMGERFLSGEIGFSGTMTRTNGDEPVDTISGTVSSDGKVQFTRDRSGQWTQVYTGMISSSQGSYYLTGTFTQSGSAPVPWSATQTTSADTLLRELVKNTDSTHVGFLPIHSEENLP